MVDSKDGDEVGSDHGDAFWREKLTDDEYAVLRNKGTERAFTGEYWDVFDDGTYHCRGCGWPSFDRALSQEAVAEARDTSHGMIRTEILCKSCGGHLGHVFPDGPTDTGLRYCVNSLSVRLESDAD